MNNRVRVMIADDHFLVAELCKRLLETEFDVVGVVGDGRALVSAARDLKPEVIVLDVAMPILNGLDAARQLKEILPLVKLIYLTMNPDVDIAVDMCRSRVGTGSSRSVARQIIYCIGSAPGYDRLLAHAG